MWISKKSCIGIDNDWFRATILYCFVRALHSLSIRNTVLFWYWVMPCFSLRTASGLGGIDSTWCLKESFESLPHVDMIASGLFYTSVRCTLVLQCSHYRKSQRFSFEFRWYLGMPLKLTELDIVMFMKVVGDNLYFVTWSIIPPKGGGVPYRERVSWGFQCNINLCQE